MNALPPGYQQALMQQMLGGQTGMPGGQPGMQGGAGGQGQGGVGAGMPIGPSFAGPDMTNGQVQGVTPLPPAQPGDAAGSMRQMPMAQPGDAGNSMRPLGPQPPPNVGGGAEEARRRLIEAMLQQRQG